MIHRLRSENREAWQGSGEPDPGRTLARDARRTLSGLCCALLAAPAFAQRMPMPDDDGRILQLFDLRKLLQDEVHEPWTTDGTRAAASMLHDFVEPALRSGDDLVAIGDRWIAVLADAERLAYVDRMFQVARERRNDLLTIEVRLFEVPAEAFVAQVQPQLVEVQRDGGTHFEAVIANDETAAFLSTLATAAGKALEAPRLSVRPWQHASVSVVTQVPYVKDFEVEIAGSASMTCTPVVGTVWEGSKGEFSATFLPDHRIGLHCAVEFQQLQRPIPEFETVVVVGTQPVRIQLPRTSGVRLQDVAVVEAGALVALAARCQDSSFRVAVIKATAAPMQPGPVKIR